MRCEECDTLIHLSLDGRLDGEQEKRLREHLAACERCSGKLAFLKATEKRARAVEQEEPPQEYWNSFSSRVMAKIETGERKRPAFGIGRMRAGLFAMPPARLRIAAGIVSVAVVAVVVILYMNRRGGDIVPPRTAETPQRRSAVQSPAGEESGVREQRVGAEGESVAEKEAEKRSVVAGAPGGEGAATDRVEAAKGMTAEGAEPREQPEDERDRRTEPAPSAPEGDATAEEPASASTEETGDAAVEPAYSAPEPPAVAEEAAPSRVEDEARVGERDVRRLAVEKTKGAAGRHVAGGRERASVYAGIESLHTATREYFDLDGAAVPSIGDADTLLPESVLRATVDAWSAYIEENPSDPLVPHGYEQVATCYYLLVRLGARDSYVAEGVRRIERYVERTGDPALKDILLQKLQEIDALREKRD